MLLEPSTYIEPSRSSRDQQIRSDKDLGTTGSSKHHEKRFLVVVSDHTNDNVKPVTLRLSQIIKMPQLHCIPSLHEVSMMAFVPWQSGRLGPPCHRALKKGDHAFRGREDRNSQAIGLNSSTLLPTGGLDSFMILWRRFWNKKVLFHFFCFFLFFFLFFFFL